MLLLLINNYCLAAFSSSDISSVGKFGWKDYRPEEQQNGYHYELVEVCLEREKAIGRDYRLAHLFERFA